MSFSIIVAMDENNGIGKDNKLLVYLPNDLKHFKQITTGHTVIMGRKTYQSLPNGALPNRRNIVLSKSLNSLPDAIVVNTLDELMKLVSEEDENFIIGGAQIYELFLPMTEKIYLTRIHARLDADTFFPRVNWENWQLIDEEKHFADIRHPYDYTFQIFRRKR